MSDICLILGLLLLVLAVVTVVGHGLWLLVAGLVRLMTGRANPRDPREITGEHLQHLHRAGRIDYQTYERVFLALYDRTPEYGATPTVATPEPERTVVPPPIPYAATADIQAAPQAPLRVQTPTRLDVLNFQEQRARASVVPPPVPVIPIAPAAPAIEPFPPFVQAPAPAPPRRRLSEVLASFMEESNIRWGELVGGLLVIGCSVALVITFWPTIAAQPWLRFFLFTGVTAALFGVGLYTEHRWKLPTTSRGVLLIATMLVPLNFLALTSFGHDAARHYSALAGEAIAFVLFAWLTWLAGKVLMRPWAIALPVGVMLPSVVQSAIARSVMAPLLLAGAVLPSYALSAALMIRVAARRLAVTPDTTEAPNEEIRRLANKMLVLLGIASFAAALPLMLLTYHGASAAAVLRQIAPVLGLFALPALATGLLLLRTVTAPALAAVRATGTAVAVFGGFLLMGSIAAAWPDPKAVLATALIAFAALTAIAFLLRIASAHLLALVCAVLAYLVGFHLAAGHFAGGAGRSVEVLRILFSPTTGPALIPLFAVMLGCAEWLARRRWEDAKSYGVVAGAVAGLSIVVSTVHGFTRPLGADHAATWVFAFYATAALAIAWRKRRPEATFTGAALLAVALAHVVIFGRPGGHADTHRLLALGLIHSTACIGGSLAARAFVRDDRRREAFDTPLSTCGMLGTCAAAIVIVGMLVESVFGAGIQPRFSMLAVQTAWLAALWLVISCMEGWPGLFGTFQVALGASVVLAATAQAGPALPLLDPRMVQRQALALAMLSIAWALVRLGLRRMGVVAQRAVADEAPIQTEWVHRASVLLYPKGLSVDRLTTYVVLAVLIVLSLGAAVPGIEHELARHTKPVGMMAWSLLPTAGTWLLLAAMMAALAASLWDRFERALLFSMMVGGFCGCLLLSARADAINSTASALRHLAGLVLLIGSAPLWLRQPVVPALGRLGWPGWERRLPGLTRELRSLLLFLTLIPILGITLYAALQTIAGATLVGPAATSPFRAVGSAANYLVPLLLAVIVLVGHAVRERSAAFAFAAGVLLNLTVTLGYALHLATSGRPFDTVALVRAGQFNAIAAAGFALAWLAVIRFSVRPAPEHHEPSGQTPPLLLVQVAIALVLLLVLLVPAELAIVLNPGERSLLTRHAGHGWSWLGWALTAGCICWIGHARWRRIPFGAVAAVLVVLGSLVALGPAHGESAWFNYHILLASRGLSAWLLLAAGALAARQRMSAEDLDEERPVGAAATRWVLVLAGMTLLLSLRAYGEPAGPGWSVAGLLCLSALAVGLAQVTFRSAWLYATGLLLNIAVSIWWLNARPLPTTSWFIDFMRVNVLVLAAGGLGLLMLEMFLLRPLRQQVAHRGVPAYHRVAALLSLIGLGGITAAALLSDFFGGIALSPVWLLLLPAIATLALALACLYDPDSRYAVGGIYLATLLAALAVLHVFGFSYTGLLWRVELLLAAHVVAAGFLFTQRARLALSAEPMGVPLREGWPVTSARWLTTVTIVQTAAVFLLALPLVFVLDSFWLRVAVSTCTIAATTALFLLAQDQLGADPTRPAPALQHLTLSLATCGVVLWGWSLLTPHGRGAALNYLVALMVSLAVVSAFCAVGLVKVLRRENAWTHAAKALTPFLAAGSALALLLVLGTEVALWRPPRTEMSLAAFLAVAATMVGLSAVCILCAVVPGRDPLGLSERARTAYVYAAELLLVLLFVHTKLVFPDILKLGIWSRFWPVIVMLLAFLGVGLSENFRRQGRRVLYEPLQNTAAFLPLFPVAMFFLLRDTWSHIAHVNYAAVLALAAGVYAVLAALRRSFAFGLLAALAANASLWYLLKHTEHLRFAQHPQLWMIPAALSVLAAAYLNRDRLSAEQMRTVRYLCLIVIYISSTADFWINRDTAPWLPLVLAVLSVIGVMAGIWMRVQSFLYLGTVFLLVSVVGMINYAVNAVGSNWPWWAAGLVLGAGIIVVFALFEKKREEMLALVEGLKEWQA